MNITKKITRKLSIPSCNFGICQKYNIVFMGCVFESEIYDGDSNGTEYKGVCFKQCEFLKKFDLSRHNITIHNQFIIQDCTFEKEVRINANFKCDVYFNNSTFQDSADFYECEFEKVACFYGATFEKVLNFSQAIFNGNVNLVNTNLNFNFDELNEKIKQEYNSYIGTEYEKSLDKFANDFRDSFRLFKNALITENNLLDASQWHKLELYSKEIELDSKKPNTFSRDWIDKIVLRFYRHTSDHHTDLMRIIHWVIILIGYFSLTLFLGKYNYHLEIFFNNHSNNMPINLTNDFINTMVESKLIYLISFIAYIGICLKPIRLLIGYIGTFLIITINPKYIFGIASIFSNKYHFTYTENIIITIYSILMFLLLFSLQKTARKNSIVPH